MSEEVAGIWDLQSEKGKEIKLKGKRKQQEFQRHIDKIGKYVLVFNCGDHLPSGPRKIQILIQVFTGIPDDQKIVEAEDGYEDLTEFHDECLEYENLFHSELLEVDSSDPIQALRWNIDEEQLPARVRVILLAKTHVLGMKISGKMFKDPDWIESDSIPQKYIPKSTFIYAEQSTDDIDVQLKRDTEEIHKAFKKGMIRPFLLLVSMHPNVRQQVAEALSIDINGKDVRGDSHAESWQLLNKFRKGLMFLADHSWETLNPLSHAATWYQCLYRSITEVKKRNHFKIEKLSYRESQPICKDNQLSTCLDLELRVLKNARSFHHKVLKKTSKKLKPKVNQLMEDKQIIQLFESLTEYGITDKKIHQFIVEICVLVHFNNWARKNKQRGKVKEKVEEKKEKVKEKVSLSDKEAVKFTKDEEQKCSKREQDQRALDSLTHKEDGDDDDYSDSEEYSDDGQDSDWNTSELKQFDDENENDAEEWKHDVTYDFTADELLKGLRNQLKKGSYTPSGFTKDAKVQKAGEKASIKGGKKGTKQTAKYVTHDGGKSATENLGFGSAVASALPLAAMAPLVPFMFVPWTVANTISKIAGSDHATLWSICVQIVLQNILLACNDINLESYYDKLSEEYRQQNEEGDVGHFEHRNWKKALKEEEKKEEKEKKEMEKEQEELEKEKEEIEKEEEKCEKEKHEKEKKEKGNCEKEKEKHKEKHEKEKQEKGNHDKEKKERGNHDKEKHKEKHEKEKKERGKHEKEKEKHKEKHEKEKQEKGNHDKEKKEKGNHDKEKHEKGKHDKEKKERGKHEKEKRKEKA